MLWWFIIFFQKLTLSHCSNSGIAIFCMLLTYYMWIKAVKTGSVYWSSMCALAYFYMVRMKRSLLSFIRTWGFRGEHDVCVFRFLPGVATCSWSTSSPSMSWCWCSQVVSLTGYMWLTAQSTAWALFCPCRSLLLVSRYENKLSPENDDFLGHLLSSLSFLLNTPASPVIGAHGSFWCVWLVSDSCLCGLPAQQTQYPTVRDPVQECHLSGGLHPAVCGGSSHADR